MTARISEPDIWPLAVQGPNAEELMARMFGDGIVSLGFFRHREFSFQGTRLTISRSGFSRQDGFEIYLPGTELGPALWDSLMNAGTDLDVRAGCPNLADRIEAGLLSYRNDMNHENSPLEVGFERSCVLDGSIRFAGRDALRELSAKPNTRRRIAGVVFDGPPCPACSEGWNIYANDRNVGEITSGAWSPGTREERWHFAVGPVLSVPRTRCRCRLRRRHDPGRKDMRVADTPTCGKARLAALGMNRPTWKNHGDAP